MLKTTIIIIITTIITFLLTAQFINHSQADQVDHNTTQPTYTVILGNYSSQDMLGNWKGETAPYMKIIDQNHNITEHIPMCDSAYQGVIYGQPVFVVTTGMAKVKTTACLMDLFENYHSQIKEVILVGTGGFSPSVEDTSNQNYLEKNQHKVLIGDLCINSIAVDFDLQHYSADQVNSKLSNPIFWDQNADFTSKSVSLNPQLASQLIEASNQLNWGMAPHNIQQINIDYQGTNRKPRVWSNQQCLELSSDLYWHDKKADIRARIIAANALNTQFNLNLTSQQVIAVTSMEAVPAGLVIKWWNQHYQTKIQFAYVRGASNFDFPKVKQQNIPEISPQENIEYFQKHKTSTYAIQNTAQPVLKLLNNRSKIK